MPFISSEKHTLNPIIYKRCLLSFLKTVKGRDGSSKEGLVPGTRDLNAKPLAITNPAVPSSLYDNVKVGISAAKQIIWAAISNPVHKHHLPSSNESFRGLAGNGAKLCNYLSQPLLLDLFRNIIRVLSMGMRLFPQTIRKLEKRGGEGESDEEILLE
jgi:hypothetical protein